MEKSVQSTKIINRNTSIELLRIISMIMIMFHHFAYHGNFEWNFNEVTLPHLWYDFILMGGKVGVDIFVLISGYFLIENIRFFSYLQVKSRHSEDGWHHAISVPDWKRTFSGQGLFLCTSSIYKAGL